MIKPTEVAKLAIVEVIGASAVQPLLDGAAAPEYDYVMNEVHSTIETATQRAEGLGETVANGVIKWAADAIVGALTKTPVIKDAVTKSHISFEQLNTLRNDIQAAFVE